MACRHTSNAHTVSKIKMTDVNALNAVARERARIRSEVVMLPVAYTHTVAKEDENDPTLQYVRLSEVLQILHG